MLGDHHPAMLTLQPLDDLREPVTSAQHARSNDVPESAAVVLRRGPVAAHLDAGRQHHDRSD
jgi:hypothetical protein